MFELAESTIARWAPLQGDGMEHLHLSREGGEFVARAVVVGERGGMPYGARYQINCDEDWRVRAFDVSLVDGRQLCMTSNGEGRWFNEAGSPVPAFDGCIDIDLAATPFTNTLPIRRAGLEQGETRHFRMLYVPFDTLMPVVDSQRYTCLEAQTLYRYEASGRSFMADLPVDRYGLVTDYPTLFRRLR